MESDDGIHPYPADGEFLHDPASICYGSSVAGRGAGFRPIGGPIQIIVVDEERGQSRGLCFATSPDGLTWKLLRRALPSCIISTLTTSFATRCVSGEAHRLRDETVMGDPDPEHVSTSYVERSNLTMRMSIRRFTRPTNGFSKKLDNHGHAVALYFLHYNFCRVHQMLRVTPAMEAGLANHVWTIEELISLLKINSHHELAV